MRFAFLLLAALFLAKFHRTMHNHFCTFFDNLHCAYVVSLKSPNEPLLGSDPKNQIHLGPTSSIHFTRNVVSSMDAPYFAKHTTDLHATSENNLDQLRSLVLVRMAITNPSCVTNLADEEAKKALADAKIKKLLGMDDTKTIETLSPEHCAKVCKKLKKEMGPLNFKLQNASNTTHQASLIKLRRLPYKIITSIPRSFYRLSLYDSFSNT